MAKTITYTLEDAAFDRLVAAICAEYEYDMNANPGETQPQFANRMIKTWLKDMTLRVEKSERQANEGAYLQAQQDDWEAANPEPKEIAIQ